jgi:pyridoxine 5'-phosphate synthase PdxJ
MKNTILFATTSAVVAIFIALVGCETEKLTDTQLSVSPTKATIAPGESLVLTAQGGWDYTWEILEPRNGTLSTYNGKKVTYMAPDLDPNSTSGMHVTDTIQVHSASNHTANAIITVHADGEISSDNSQSDTANDNSND